MGKKKIDAHFWHSYRIFRRHGGCAMLGQSLINVNAGGRTRISSTVAAVVLLLFILFFSDYKEIIPMADLVGLMFMVAIGTFEWAFLKMFGNVPVSDLFVMVLVTWITVILHNSALAVLIGVTVAALLYSWENLKRICARKRIDEHGVKHYEIYGPLFFASATNFPSLYSKLLILTVSGVFGYFISLPSTCLPMRIHPRRPKSYFF